MKWLVSFLAVFSLLAIAAVADDKAGDQWVEQKNPAFLAERQVDGDSFGMTVESPKKKRVKRTYRLYGADCPESNAKDKLLVKRIEEQAEYFGVRPQDIPEWGKKATDYTEKLLLEGKPRVFTFGYMGEKAIKLKGRPQRYYAMIEVTAPDGQRHWLHELLLETGMARAHGERAAWPEKTARHRGEKDAKELFMKGLERLEKKAKEARRGIWGKP